MPIEFDPYFSWLGIQSTEQPLDHYALLGLTRFESSEKLIDQHSVQRIELLQDIATGSEQVELSQQILNEISAARICLLDQRKRAKYDLRLKKQIAGFDSAVSRIERLSASEEATKKKELPGPTAAPIRLNISTDLESKKRKSGENPIPRISKKKKPWVFPLVAMIIPLLMGIGVLIGVHIFVTPELREDFDKLNYGRGGVIETIHNDEPLGDPLNLNETKSQKSTENQTRKKIEPQNLSPAPTRGTVIASYFADSAKVAANRSNLSAAISPEKQNWNRDGVKNLHASDISRPAENSELIAWKTGDKECDGIDFRMAINESEFDKLHNLGWQLTVIARLIHGPYRFQLSPSQDSDYWKRDHPAKPYGCFSIQLKKRGNQTEISVSGNQKSSTTINDGFAKFVLEGAPEQDNCTLKVYSFDNGQEPAKLIHEAKDLKPNFQAKRSSQISMSTMGPRKNNPQGAEPRTSPSEIWIHKVELKTLK